MHLLDWVLVLSPVFALAFVGAFNVCAFVRSIRDMKRGQS